MSTESSIPKGSPTAVGKSRRAEILTTAAKLFAARGYHGTRMDDIADTVGLNKATVYHYYAGKALILYDIYKSSAELIVTALHDAPGASAREMLFQFTHRLLGGMAHDIERAAVYFQEAPYIAERFTEGQIAHIRNAEATVYEHVHGVFEHGIASGEFYPSDPHVLALGYIGMTLGAYRWINQNSPRTPSEIAVEISTALLRGLVRDQELRIESPLGQSVPSDGHTTLCAR